MNKQLTEAQLQQAIKISNSLPRDDKEESGVRVGDIFILKNKRSLIHRDRSDFYIICNSITRYATFQCVPDDFELDLNGDNITCLISRGDMVKVER